jgi:uncharacterized protein (TIGR03083 family)
VQYGHVVSMFDFDHLTAITEHSEGFATSAEGNLEARVEHCPGWNVADLVWHLSSVHWFWATIVEERLKSPPDESLRPERPSDDKLVDRFRTGAHRLVEVLERAPDDARVWTWTPAQRDVAFVSRHQVQEAAVHHWDAAHAAGMQIEFGVAMATDAVAEFLTFSLASADDPADPPPAALGGAFVIASSDSDAAWTIQDGPQPGTLSVIDGTLADRQTVRASSSDLLLWLYQRIELRVPSELAPMIGRFRALTFTD